MEFPEIVRKAVELRASAWQPSVLKNTSADITRRYKNNSKNGSRLIVNDADALVYSIVRMPATFAAVGAALSYALECTDCELCSMIDAGSGTGAAVWAASEFCELTDITCIEREASMRRLGAELMKASPALSAAGWLDMDISCEEINLTADLVCESYMLNEMQDDKRRDTVRKLWNCTDKMLLLVEPGTPEGFSVLQRSRAELLGMGAHIAAPCMHEGQCRIADGDWCHFTARVQRSRLHKMIKGGDVPYEDEKFAYLAVSRTPADLNGARVLRHPISAKGRITLSVCTENENKEITVTKSSPLYKQARKAACGDRIGGI